MDIYSTRFLCQAGLSGTGPSFAVPSGFVLVVKQVTAYCDPGAADVRVFLEDDTTGAALWSHDFPAGSAGWGEYFGSWVFPGPLGFHFNVDVTIGFTSTADVYAGGFQLVAP